MFMNNNGNNYESLEPVSSYSAAGWFLTRLYAQNFQDLLVLYFAKVKIC